MSIVMGSPLLSIRLVGERVKSPPLQSEPPANGVGEGDIGGEVKEQSVINLPTANRVFSSRSHP